jgi:hypothetical protein
MADFYHIVVRPKSLFSTFRNQDVGEKGGLERLAGKRKATGRWATHAWLVHKSMAHVDGHTLAMDHPDAQKLLRQFTGVPTYVDGTMWQAKEKNVREVDKPTAAMTAARKKNIKKAHSSRKAK